VTHPVNKYNIALNLKHPGGIEIFKKLIAWADVIIENLTMGAMERLGLGYNEVKRIKPSIIMYRTNGYGHTGPMASMPGLGQTITALTGFHGVSGWRDRPSVPIGAPYSDLLSPLLGGLALISAIDYARRTDKGQCIDQSQAEASINYLSPIILDYIVNGRELALNGNRNATAAPHGAYRCKGNDRWVAIAVFTDEEWDAFCRVIGNPFWARDAKFSTQWGRVENSDELDRLVESWTINFTAEQVMAIMQADGVCAGVVATAQDVEEDPQLKHYNYFCEREHPYLGKLNFYHPPGFRLSKADAEVAAPSLLGEHTKYICTEILDMSNEEYSQLLQEGVFK
jgi:benzylsuccinate CoA-transferase BbsF subunit